jgi:hypothetical protein
MNRSIVMDSTLTTGSLAAPLSEQAEAPQERGQDPAAADDPDPSALSRSSSF